MAGRPKSSFSDEEVAGIEQYAREGNYAETIARGMDIAVNTLKRHFGRKMRKWRAAGKLNLRHNLYEQASISPQTAIFIAKNELGMTDKQVIATEQVESKTSTGKELRAAKRAAAAYADEMAREDDKPRIVPITGAGGR